MMQYLPPISHLVLVKQCNMFYLFILRLHDIHFLFMTVETKGGTNNCKRTGRSVLFIRYHEWGGSVHGINHSKPLLHQPCTQRRFLRKFL